MKYAKTKKQLLTYLNLPRSSYYYKPKKGKKGKNPSSYTYMIDGRKLRNSEILDEIDQIIKGKFNTYGYIKVTYALKNKGYIINKKKVYRMMKSNKLLLRKQISTKGKRNFVKNYKVVSTKPYECMETDIKQIYIPEIRRNMYLLSVIDTYSRKIFGHMFKRSIRKKQVIELLKSIIQKAPIKNKEIRVRSDNGGQFIANDVRNYLKKVKVSQEFIHVATPEENGHIESFHSLIQREFLDRLEIYGEKETRDLMNEYMYYYNYERLHGAIGYKTPAKYYVEYFRKVKSECKNSEIVSN